MRLNCILIIFIQTTFCLFELTSALVIPKAFDDKILPKRQRNGQFVEFLGHIIKLNTLFSAKDVNYISAKFSIFNRHNSIENIPFTPNKICIKESDACYGPFQYDLNLIDKSGFDPKLKTIIMISGFLTKNKVDWMDSSKDLWLQLEDVNVILVSWQDANRYVYSSAVANTPLVARQITMFLYYLAELNGLSLLDEEFGKKIHFIGHSLGAHIAGFVGQDLDGKMGRITALDPAGPSFDQMDREHRLDKRDAILVDVIHTNTGKIHYINAAATGILKATDSIINQLPLINYIESSLKVSNYTNEGDTAWFGIDTQVGDIDYYANNGRVQPGCSDLLHICDHGRASDIFVDILSYEVELMRYATTRQNIEQHRLMAFQSNDYENFLSGQSFNMFCPDSLKQKVCLNSSEKNRRSCSIPIDLLTSVDDLEKEFKDKYNIYFDNDDEEYNQEAKYYFKTLETRPLMGDHYLLKLHLNKLNSSWNEACALKTKISTTNGFKTEIILNKHINLVDNDDFYGIAMPFVTTNGAGARDALNNILLSPLSKNNKQLRIDGHMLELLQRALPSRINFELKQAQSSGMVEAVKQKLKNLLLWDKFRKQSTNNCYLAIELIEIKPLIKHNRDLVALYKRDKCDSTITAFGYEECDNNIIEENRKHNPIMLTIFNHTSSLDVDLDSLLVEL